MIIDGTKIAAEIRAELKQKIDQIALRKPALAVILVGDHGPSCLYVQKKTAACKEVGIHSIKRHLPYSITEDELLREIEQFNVHPDIDGILVQLPLPEHISRSRVTRWIHPEKDVDGFNPINVGKMLIGESDSFIPCTPLGVKVLLDRYQVEVSGKHLVMVGRSNIVGKPLSAIFMQDAPGFNATVTLLHRLSPNIKELCRLADILVVAIGNPRYITEDYVKPGAVVIDVGINSITKEGKTKIVGDVDFERVKEKCSLITPVPGGVGPMTIAMLLSNTFLSYQRRCHLI